MEYLRLCPGRFAVVLKLITKAEAIKKLEVFTLEVATFDLFLNL